MLDIALIIALLLLVGGIVGSVAPLVPGALISLIGVYGYWWSTGYSEPSLFLLVILTVLGLVTVIVDWFGGAVGAGAGGASKLTIAGAGIAGVVLLLAIGPLGLLIGVPAFVFVVEFIRTRDSATSLKTSAYTTVGILASTAAQVMLTATMLIVFVTAIFL